MSNGIAQTPGKGFFSDLEIRLSSGASYENLRNHDPILFAETALSVMGANKAKAGISDYKTVESLPFRHLPYYYFWENDYDHYSLRFLEMSFFTYELAIAKLIPIERLNTNLMIETQFGMRRNAEYESRDFKGSLVYLNAGSYDSIKVNSTSDKDTMIQIPRYYTLEFNMPVSSYDFGLSLNMQLKGESQSENRIFLGLTGLIRINQATTIGFSKTHIDPTRYGYINYGNFDSYQYSTNTRLELINSDSIQNLNFTYKIPRSQVRTLNLNYRMDWRFGKLPVYLGVQLILGVQHYWLGSTKIHTNFNTNWGIYMVYQPSRK
jgi:hypothetical protein